MGIRLFLDTYKKVVITLPNISFKNHVKRVTCFSLIYVTLTLTACKNDLHYIDDVEKSSQVSDAQSFTYTEFVDRPLTYNVIEGRSSLQYSDGYIYFYNGTKSTVPVGNHTFYRYNTETGNITSLCPDPLCDHMTPECPFLGALNFYISNDNIFFAKNYLYSYLDEAKNVKHSSFYGYCAFNLNSSKFTVLQKHNNADSFREYENELFINNYRFYYDCVNDETTGDWIFNICRMDLTKNKTIVLDDKSNFYNFEKNTGDITTKFLFKIDDRIYFIAGNTLYSTNIDYDNRQIHNSDVKSTVILTDGEYLYYQIGTKIFKSTIDGTDVDKIGIDATYWYMTEQYIYYSVPDQTIIGKNKLSGYLGENVILECSEIRRCKHDGSNDESVYKFSNGMSGTRLTDWIVVGNYIYGEYYAFNDINGDGYLTDDEYSSSLNNEIYSFIRIDISTGEIYTVQ